MTTGTRGFLAWFEIEIYNAIRKACKNMYVKIIVHSIGLLLMVIGLFFMSIMMPSMTSIAGMFLAFIGLIVFLIPLRA